MEELGYVDVVGKGGLEIFGRKVDAVDLTAAQFVDWIQGVALTADPGIKTFLDLPWLLGGATT